MSILGEITQILAIMAGAIVVLGFALLLITVAFAIFNSGKIAREEELSNHTLHDMRFPKP